MAKSGYPIQDEEAKWRAENDLRTLVSAMEIKKDKKRYKAAMDYAKTQIKALEEVKA